MKPVKQMREALTGEGGPKARWFLPQSAGGWTEPVVMEWELTGESWTDLHPHNEYAYVLEGRLFVESGGVTVECAAGDFVTVPAGAKGRYWAPDYARILGIYGPNPEGGDTDFLGFEKLKPTNA